MSRRCLPLTTSGITRSFPRLSRSSRQVTYVLLRRSPLDPKVPFDLHVLGTPPAFVLSHDQTLRRNVLFVPSKGLNESPEGASRNARHSLAPFLMTDRLIDNPKNTRLVASLFSFQGAASLCCAARDIIGTSIRWCQGQRRKFSLFGRHRPFRGRLELFGPQRKLPPCSA